MTNEQSLLPCPFCGSRDAPRHEAIGQHRGVWCRVTRGGCGAVGPPETEDEDCIKAWNRRAVEPSAERICYMTCDKHRGMSWTMMVTAQPTPFKTVCPICEPPPSSVKSTGKP